MKVVCHAHMANADKCIDVTKVLISWWLWDTCQLMLMLSGCQQAEKSLTSNSKASSKQQPRPKRKRELRRQQIREAVEKASRDAEGYEVKVPSNRGKEDFDEQALKILKKLMASMGMEPGLRKSFVTQGEPIGCFLSLQFMM